HRIEAISVFRRQAHDQREAALAFEDRGRFRAAESGLDDTVDVTGIETIASCYAPVDGEIQVRLSENSEDTKVGDPFYFIQNCEDLSRYVFQSRQIRTDDLD